MAWAICQSLTRGTQNGRILSIFSGQARRSFHRSFLATIFGWWHLELYPLGQKRRMLKAWDRTGVARYRQALGAMGHAPRYFDSALAWKTATAWEFMFRDDRQRGTMP